MSHGVSSILGPHLRSSVGEVRGADQVSGAGEERKDLSLSGSHCYTLEGERSLEKTF